MRLKKISKRWFLKLLLPSVVIGFAFYIIVSYIFALYYNHPVNIDFLSILATIFLAGIVIEGTRRINIRIDRNHSWLRNPKKRFWIQLTSNLIFSVVMISLFGTLITVFVSGDPFVHLFDIAIFNITGILIISKPCV